MRHDQSRLQRDLEKSQGDAATAFRDSYALQDEIADLEQRLDLAADVSRKLEEAAQCLEEVTDELDHVKQQQLSLEKLKKESLSQQQDIEAKSQELQTLRKEVEQQQVRSTLLEEHAREKDRLAEANADINTQLKELRKEVSKVPTLQQQVQQKNTRIAELESALATSQQQAQEKDKLTEENAAIHNQMKDLRKEVSVMTDMQKRLQQQNTKIVLLESALTTSQSETQQKNKLAEENVGMHKQLKELRKEVSVMADVQMELQQKNTKVLELETAFTAAQDQAAQIPKLQERNTSLKEGMASLSSDLEQVNEECAQIPPLKASIKAKDDQLAELQKRLDSMSSQTEELDKLKENMQEKEEQQATMQQQILSLEGALSNPKLDEEARPAQQQRRIADRSGNVNVPVNHHQQHSDHDANANGVDALQLPGSSIRLTGHTTMVPETQFEVQESPPVDPDSLILPPGQQDDSESELTPIPSDDEDADVEDGIEESGLRDAQGHVPRVRVPDGTQNSQDPLERPPSSSYESHSDQMLLDQVSQGETQGADDVSASTAPNLVMPWNRLVTGQETSPRRLRSGSQGQGQGQPLNASPEPDAVPRRNRASTPALIRERHQPNSAAKRRVEPEMEDNASQENSKRLKRRPANLEVKKPQPSTPKQGEQTPSRGTISYRKSSSIVSTNAPAPGKSQKASKPARKGSRHDRYAARFAAET